MKTRFKIALMAATAMAITGFTACKRGGDITPPDEVRPAALSITLVNPADKTRVAGTAPETGTNINDFSLFVIDGRGDVGWSKYVDGTEATSGKAYIEVTTDAKAIYVIANAGSDLHETYRTQEALEAAGPLADDLYDQYDNRWATGSVVGTSWDFQDTDTNGNGLLEQKVSVPLKFIAARIKVTVYNKMNGYTGADDGTLKITNVAVLNARGQSRLFPGTGSSLVPTPYAANKKYLQGIANGSPAFTYYPNAADITVEAAGTGKLNNAYTWPGSGTTPFNSYFWVFESDATLLEEFPTIVTLVGTDADNPAGPVYFPVHFASYETWADNDTNYAGGIKRGNSYNVTITLNGDATQGNGGGTDDPTVNVENVEIVATLTITPWVDIALGKNF